MEFLRRLQALTEGRVEWAPEAEDQEQSGAVHANTESTDAEIEWITEEEAHEQFGTVHANTDSTDAEIEALYADSDDDIVSRMRQTHIDQKTNEVNHVQSSPNLNKARPPHTKRAQELEKEALGWKETALKKGERAPSNQQLSPWKLITAYPDIFIGERNRPRASPFFENAAIHDNRVWDFYYIHHPPNHPPNHPRALPTQQAPQEFLFVPTYQFENLLEVINARLGDTNFIIPTGSSSEVFKLVFGADGTPPARFLGRSTSPEQFNVLKENIPAVYPEDFLHSSNPANDEFINKLNMVRQTVKKKKGVKPAKILEQRIAVRKAWGSSIKRVQRYLGLREKNVFGQESAKTPDPIDLSKPLSAQTEDPVIFAAIDVESFELNHDLITEVGIATLDTRDIKGVAPGESGKGWFPLIKAHHLRIDEATWAVNKIHVQGCPNNFLFGESAIVSQHEMVEAIKKIIHVPYSEADAVKNQRGNVNGPPHRPVVLVFHDSTQDLQYLNHLGYRVGEFDHILIDHVDTRLMAQYINKANQGPSLRSVLYDLKLESSFLHNAGNDSCYTLQCMLGLAIEKRVESINRARTKNADVPVPFAELVGWESDGISDGGLGMPPAFLKDSSPEN